MKKILFLGLLAALVIMPACNKKETQEETQNVPKGNVLVETFQANRSLYGMKYADLTKFLIPQGWTKISVKAQDSSTADFVCSKAVDGDSVFLNIAVDSNLVCAYEVVVVATSDHYAYAEKIVREFMTMCTKNFQFSSDIVCPFVQMEAGDENLAVVASYSDFDDAVQHVGDALKAGVMTLTVWQKEAETDVYDCVLSTDNATRTYSASVFVE